MYYNRVTIKDINNNLENKIKSITSQVTSEITLNPQSEKEYNKCLNVMDSIMNRDKGVRGNTQHDVWNWIFSVGEGSIVKIIYKSN